ncbi:MAG: homoserine O-succinyltransferase [Rhizobiales bacterium]|nr:homoserine O-succinyltransferase [Hyphomicrobiales bacterium]MBI3673052.1 homoserine O-succinyltransferase [Hyphomicrobiales bacterium]
MSRHFDGSKLGGAVKLQAVPSLGIRPPVAAESRVITVALVNNMPDSAFAATERQFTGLVESMGRPVRIGLFHLPEISRGSDTTAAIAARYRPVEELYAAGTDALIVTGNEPKAPVLSDEPYWPALTRLVDWARTNTRSTLWSCLAAHAAVLHLDGIARRPLPAKRSGLFTSRPADNRWAGLDLPGRLAICHSRHNDLAAGDLVNKDYRILTRAGDGTVDIFAKDAGSHFLFLQGHPEYDADSLMREYRRDVGRFLAGTRASYPEIPENYFDAGTVRRMQALRLAAEKDRRPDIAQPFPPVGLRRGLADRMRRSAVAVYKSWMAKI